MLSRIYQGFIQSAVVIIIGLAYFQGVQQFVIAGL